MIKFVSALAAVAMLLSPHGVSAQGRPAGVVTDLVTEERISETVAVFGEIVAGRQSRVAARIAGVAMTVPIDVGDRVAEGDVLAEIDTDLLQIEVAQAEAAVAVAEAAASTARIQVENAETAFARAQSLRENSVIADAAYEERESALAVARGTRAEAAAGVAASMADLRRAQYDLDNAVVRAPFAGVIVGVGTEVGQFVSQGAEIVRLIDTEDMEVEANIPARYVDALQPGQEVAARTDAGGEMTLRLRARLPTEFSDTRTRPVLFEVISKEGVPAAGQSVTLNVPISAPRDVIAVPKDALVQARGGWQVFVAADGVAEPRTVEIGAALGDRHEVISGVSPGEAVVVRGNERLRPGQAISPTPIGGGGDGSGAPGQGGAATRQGGEASGGAPDEGSDVRQQAAAQTSD